MDHGLADLVEERQAGGQRQLARATPGVDALALHMLHHQIGPAQGRAAAVHQPGDVRMAQRGQDAPFARQLRQRRLAGKAAQELERHALLVQAVGALRLEDLAHAALAQFGAQHPRAEAVTGFQFGRPAAGHHGRQRGREMRDGGAVLGHQGHHLLGFSCVGAQRLQVFAAGRVVGQIRHRFEEALDARQRGRGLLAAHQASRPRPSCSLSQARPKRSSRSTVASDTPSTSATSAPARPVM
jgi:hypothetical protein